jgi:hypothetical protein
MDVTERGKEHALRANRLATSGVESDARIDAMVETGNSDANGSREYHVKLTVHPRRAPSYEATTRQYIHPSASFAEGMDVTVKVDPADSGELILWDAG